MLAALNHCEPVRKHNTAEIHCRDCSRRVSHGCIMLNFRVAILFAPSANGIETLEVLHVCRTVAMGGEHATQLHVDPQVLLIVAAVLTAFLIVAGVLLVLNFQQADAIERAHTTPAQQAPAEGPSREGPRRRQEARPAAAVARDDHETADEVRNEPSFVE